MNERFAICIEAGGYEVSLERWKVYRVLEDTDAEAHQHCPAAAVDLLP